MILLAVSGLVVDVSRLLQSIARLQSQENMDVIRHAIDDD
jgi:hypothetical protein